VFGWEAELFEEVTGVEGHAEYQTEQPDRTVTEE
jgi:hypothetical protein